MKVVSGFASERFLHDADAVLATDKRHAESLQQAAKAAGAEADEAEAEAGDVFDPVAGTVAVGSAADGWAVRLDQFADM